MNSQVKTIVLIVVIVACLGFVVFRLVGSGGGGSEGTAEEMGPQERTLYCTACKKTYTAEITEAEFMPLMMAGMQSPQKHTCPTCSKAAGVACMDCPHCGEKIPSPGMAALSGSDPRIRAVCPKCKKSLVGAAPQG